MGSKIKEFINRWVPPLMWITIIFIISATPEPFRFLTENSLDPHLNLTVFGHNIIDLFDYPYHFLMYFILGALIARALIWHSSLRLKMYVFAFFILMSISLIDEFQQIAVPKRNFEAIDLVMDGLGGLGGSVFHNFLYRKKREH